MADLPSADSLLGPAPLPPADALLGPAPEPKPQAEPYVSKGLVSRWAGPSNGPVTPGGAPLMQKIVEGMGDAFGSEPLGFSQENEQWLIDHNLLQGRATDGRYIFQFADPLIRAPAAVLDAAFRGLNSLVTGGAVVAASAETAFGGGERGGQKPEETEADRAAAYAHYTNLALLFAGADTPMMRLERGPLGDIQTTKVGGLPRAEDYPAASQALVGSSAKSGIESKMLRLYDEHGITPAEIASDVKADPVLHQDMVATNISVPRRYSKDGEPIPELGFNGKGPPKPPKDEQPAGPPPEKGSPEAAQQAILSKISVGEADTARPYSWARLYTDVVDKFFPIKKAVKESGEKLAPENDPAVLSQLIAGSAGRAHRMLFDSTVDFATKKKNGAGLQEVLAPFRDDLNGLRAYAASVRATELNARGIDAGLDLEAAQQVIAVGKDKYDAGFQQLVAYSDRVTQYLKDSGILSEKAYKAMREANRNFVPFNRVMDGEGGFTIGSGLNPRNPIKRIKGSKRIIIDPLESLIRNTYIYTRLAEKNAVNEALISLLERQNAGAVTTRKLLPIEQKITSGTGTDLAIKASGEGEIISPLKEVKEPPHDALDAEIVDFLESHGVKDAPEDLIAVIRTNAREPVGDEIHVFRDGKRHTYQVDPELARAVKGLDIETVPLLLRIASIPAKLLRMGATLTPEFLGRNPARDQFEAAILTKGGYIPAVDFVRGAVSLAKQDKAFQQWLSEGGANATLVSLDRRYMQHDLERLTEQTGLMTRAFNVVKHPIETLRIISEFAENATRLGEFKRVAGDVDRATRSQLVKAAQSSREVTLDYARIGAKTRALNMISAFFNAKVQGVDRLARAFIERPGVTALKVGATVTLPSVLLWWANHNDPRYKDLPTWQKDLFWIVLTKDHIYRIPKPFLPGVLFGSLPERLLEKFYDDNPNAMRGFDQTMVDQVVPLPIPTFAAPVIDQFANRSTFTGDVLIPDRLEQQLPEYQYNGYTTEAAKAIGRVMGAFPGMKEAAIGSGGFGGPARTLTSPILIENYVRAWTGGLGMYALQTADAALRKAGIVPDITKPTPTLADIPFVKAFVVRYPSASSAAIQTFYDRADRAKIIANTIMQQAKTGNFEAVQKELRFGGSAALARLDNLSKVIAQQSGLIRMIYANPDMSAGDKRQLIDSIYYRMIELAGAGNKTLDAFEEQTQ